MRRLSDSLFDRRRGDQTNAYILINSLFPSMNSKHLLASAVAGLLVIGGFDLCRAEAPAVTKPAPKLKPEEFRAKVKKDDSPLPNGGQMMMSYAPVAEKIMPSVVRVTSTVRAKAPQGGLGMDRIPPQMREFFRRFYGVPDDGSADPFGGDDDQSTPQPRRRGKGGEDAPKGPAQKGTGSGVIISKDGYILTNNHVVADAEKLEVTVGSESKNYTATVIGTDPLTDVAIIKIDATGLTAATIGDASKLHVGDVVLAAGNPMELSQTLTQGIVSALGRTGMGIVHQGMNPGIENFIQTDAAINPGNSGGPLVDALGRVVGINTAIMTQSGMNAGIGFSIPINLALRVAEDLVDDGKVSRGFLGVGMENLQPGLEKALGLPDASGVLVNKVVADSPAAKAGIQEGDVIVAVNGQHVDNSMGLRSLIASCAADTTVDISLVRDTKRLTLKAKLGGASDDEIAGRAAKKEGPSAEKDADPDRLIKGLSIQDLTDGLRERYEIPKTVTSGVVIVGIEANTPGAGSGLEEGDVITTINNKPVAKAAEAKKLAKGSDGVLAVRVVRKGQKLFVVVREDGKKDE